MSGFAKKGSTAQGSLVAAPKTLRYEHDGGLPVAIEAKSNRRAYELEDISEYSRLYAILESIQGSRLNADEHSLTEHENFTPNAAALPVRASADATSAFDDAGAVAANQWEISEVKYVAHEVNLDDMFTNQMKMSIQATGGQITQRSDCATAEQRPDG